MQTSPFLGLFYLGRLDFTASALASMGWRRGPSACQADTPCGRRRRLRATEPYARNRTEREESNRRSTLSVTVARLLPLLGMAVGATATPLHAPEPPEPACPTQKFAPLDILEQILRDRKARIRPTERRAGMDCAERLRVWHEVERLFNANDPISPDSRDALAHTRVRFRGEQDISLWTFTVLTNVYPRGHFYHFSRISPNFYTTPTLRGWPR